MSAVNRNDRESGRGDRVGDQRASYARSDYDNIAAAIARQRWRYVADSVTKQPKRVR